MLLVSPWGEIKKCSGMDSSKFTNVEVTNGAVINDGDRLLVLGAALPGLKARLDVEDKDGKLMEQCWFDVSRLALASNEPVMERPNFEYGPQAEGTQGAAEKPKFMTA